MPSDRYDLTIFGTLATTIGSPKSYTFARLAELAANPVITPDKKFTVPLVSPGLFEGNRRGSDFAKSITIAMLDFDSGWTFDEGLKASEGFERILYTTYGNSAAKEKFRIWIPLAQPIPAAAWQFAWAKLAALFPETDKNCKDTARLFYLPCVHPDDRGLYRWHYEDGDKLSLPTRPLPVTPPSPLEYTTVHRGPRVRRGPEFANLIEFADHWEYPLEIRAEDSRGVHIICPRRDRHSDPKPGPLNETSIIGDWGFHCYHNSCADFKVGDFMRLIREDYKARNPTTTTTTSTPDEDFKPTWGRGKKDLQDNPGINARS